MTSCGRDRVVGPGSLSPPALPGPQADPRSAGAQRGSCTCCTPDRLGGRAPGVRLLVRRDDLAAAARRAAGRRVGGAAPAAAHQAQRQSTGRAPLSTAPMFVPFWGAPDGALPGRSFPHGLQTPLARRRHGHPARRHRDGRPPQRRHPTASVAGRPARPACRRQARPARQKPDASPPPVGLVSPEHASERASKDSSSPAQPIPARDVPGVRVGAGRGDRRPRYSRSRDRRPASNG